MEEIERKQMETVRFDELELNPQILRGIKDMGFEEASPIQAQAIPVVLSGRDIIGQAQTGSGKTAAFGIPVLEKVDPDNKKTQVIILSPTRELAIQVADEIRKLSKYMHGIKILPVYGGQEISKQIRSLKGGAQVIIGTPGRVMDHLRRKTIRLFWMRQMRCLIWDFEKILRQFLNISQKNVRRYYFLQLCQKQLWILPKNIKKMQSQ